MKISKIEINGRALWHGQIPCSKPCWKSSPTTACKTLKMPKCWNCRHLISSAARRKFGAALLAVLSNTPKPYPAGYKSYSKTKPIRLEEFKPEQDWWGTEASDFADRVKNEFAWKVDFKTKREQAEAVAQSHWQRVEDLNNQAAALAHHFSPEAEA